MDYYSDDTAFYHLGYSYMPSRSSIISLPVQILALVQPFLLIISTLPMPLEYGQYGASSIVMRGEEGKVLKQVIIS